MLRIADSWWDSDVGRQRTNNEDNFFARPPLFAVADGMGGAQAGEVASGETVKTFKEGMPDAPPPEALAQIIQEANRRIFEMARERTERQGMGCTCTAAFLDGDDLVVAHVGDSRAYLFRDGDLIRLTRDHSLVGDLVALGKITEEEAEQHPQRSVITRALGPEENVQVDVEVYPVRPGDVILLCSDGLTSMVNEDNIKPLLVDGEGLEATGRSLIAAANEAGGRDNITVILFRVEEGEPGETVAEDIGEGATGEYDTFTGQAVDEPRQGISKPTEDRTGTVALAAIQAPAKKGLDPSLSPAPERAPAPRQRRGEKKGSSPFFSRRLVVSLLVVVLVVGFCGWLASRAVYFIGTGDDERTVTVFRGLPYELPLGIELYSTEYESGATLDQVPARRRSAFVEHKLRSLNDAKDLVLRLERGELAR